MAGVILRGCHDGGACKNDRASELKHAASGKPRRSVSGHFGPSQAAPPYNEVVQITIGRRGYIPFLLLTRSEERSHAPLSLQLPCIAAGPAYLLPRLVRAPGDVRARAAADPPRDLSLSGRGPCPEADLAGKERRRPQPLHHHDAGRRDPDDRGVRGKIWHQGEDVARHQPEAGAAGGRRVPRRPVGGRRLRRPPATNWGPS